MSRYAFAKVDRNHVELMDAFRSLGYSVLSLASMRSGCPDALVAKDGKSVLIEFKDGPGHKLTRQQLDFVASWRGTVEVARSVDDVLAIDRRLRALNVLHPAA